MFPGFTDSETFTQLPETFFRDLLPKIEDADELKVTLYALWRVAGMEGRVHPLRADDFGEIVPDPIPALEQAVRRGSLLLVQTGSGRYYFVNSPRGRAAAESLRTGSLSPAVLASPPASPERPNVFHLYESNVGPLTPLIADALRDAEATFSEAWLAEAIEIAVKNNKRSWSYIDAILKRWKEEGHAQEQDRRDAQETRGRDVDRKIEDFRKR
ncbi:MAG: DnaD domain protein [Anaerolineales bacterium]|nr:DnaD domain protein [Anaerolineales bacterium]